MSNRLFNLGQVVGTPAALALLEKHNMSPMQFLDRHVTGDHGQICDEDKAANNEAIWNAERILSAYMVGDQKIYVITEADRSSTTLLISSEY